MNRIDAQAWLDRYVEPWSVDGDRCRSFTELYLERPPGSPAS